MVRTSGPVNSLWELASTALQLLLTSTFSAEAGHSNHVPSAPSPSCVLHPFPLATLGMSDLTIFEVSSWAWLSTKESFEFYITCITQLSSASPLGKTFLPFQNSVDSEHLSICWQQQPLVLPSSTLWFAKCPRACLTSNALITRAPGWTCKAPGDVFGWGSTLSHFRQEAHATSFILPDLLTLQTLTSSAD